MSIEEHVLQYNKATELLHKGQYKKAIVLLKKSLATIESKEALVNLGNCYRLEGNINKTFECYKRALHPSVICLESPAVIGHALNNLGLSYYTIGDDYNAQQCYTKAIKGNDKFWEAWWNNSTSVLRCASSGRPELFARGWEMYDSRFLKDPPIKLKNDSPNLQFWDTRSGGRSIVVLVEQGIGDSIMFGRYLNSLRSLFDRVIVQADPSLEGLFTGYEQVTHVSECDAEVAYPICSLAKCFNSGVPIDGKWLAGKFGSRPFPTDRFNIGIVHAGSKSHANDANRSVSSGRFNRLSSIANLYSLTPGFTSTKHIKSLGIKTWTDTAECINGLDLVISVDTSVIHLVGSMGCEGWVLQPRQETDFRWGNGVNRSAWYDTIEVFENPNSWETVFDNVELALREKLYEKC